jgi:hypothetical protein
VAADFFSQIHEKKSIQLLLETQQHKKYAQTTPLDDVIGYNLNWVIIFILPGNEMHKTIYFPINPILQSVEHCSIYCQ